MKILITGHTGLVGSNLYKRLEEGGHELLGLSLDTGCDLRDEAKVDKVIGNFKPEIVYHLAAMAAESRGQVSPVDMTQRNLGIFVNVLKASINAGMKKMMYTSSVAVYGEAGTPYKEDGPTIPKDVYGVNKLAAEQILKIMAKVYDFEYVIFRPHNIYGPGQMMDDPYKNVVALFMRKLIEGESCTLFGEGKMKRAFSYVDNVVDVFIQALKLSDITMNVGSTEAISIKELFYLIQDGSENEVEVNVLPARPQEISMFLADHALQDALVHYRETPLNVGLQKTWDWVKKKELPEVITVEKEIYV